jgi:hypothetical protein
MGLIGPSRRAIIDKRGALALRARRRRAVSIRRSHTGHNKEQVGGRPKASSSVSNGAFRNE